MTTLVNRHLFRFLFALLLLLASTAHAQSGDPAAEIKATDTSRVLSPFDPLLFAMLGSRAIAMARQGQYAEVADWAVKAASRPNAHPHIYAIAACTLARAGQMDAARAHVAAIRRVRPGYGVHDFLDAFRFDGDGEAVFMRGAAGVGL